MLRQRNFVGNPQRDEVLRIVLLLLYRWQEALRIRRACVLTIICIVRSYSQLNYIKDNQSNYYLVNSI